jgi:hypothetical protein
MNHANFISLSPSIVRGRPFITKLAYDSLAGAELFPAKGVGEVAARDSLCTLVREKSELELRVRILAPTYRSSLLGKARQVEVRIGSGVRGSCKGVRSK